MRTVGQTDAARVMTIQCDCRLLWLSSSAPNGWVLQIMSVNEMVPPVLS